MKLDETHPANRGLFAYFRDAGHSKAPPLAPFESGPRPYLELGSHPDIVTRVWNDLGAQLPADSKAIVFGTPALVHPEVGVVLAMAFGTSYLLHLPADLAAEARAAAYATSERWSDGTATELTTTLGDGWFFGRWRDEEAEWLASALLQLTFPRQTLAP